MAVNKNFVVKNGLEVKSNLLVADTSLDSVGIGTSYIKEKLHVIGGVGATSLFVGGIGTVHVATGTTARYENVNITGVGTIATFKANAVDVANINVSAAVTANKFYGDGSTLTGVSVGVRTAGAVVGYGVTFLDFRGAGVSTAYFNTNVGIATVFFQGGGGSGTVSISSATPSNPTNGDLWYSIDYGRTFVYYDEVELGVGSTAVWVDAAPFNAGGKYIGAYGGTSYGAIGNTAGTKTVPSWNFTDDSNTGIFQGGTADHLSFAAGGSGIATVNVGGVTVSGIVTAHSVSLSGDATVAGNMNITGDLVYNEERAVNSLVSGTSTITNANATQMSVTGVGTFGGSVSIGDSIIHTGDTDTSLRFPSANTISLNTGNLEALRVDSGQRLLIGQTANVHSLTDKVQISGTDATSSIYLNRYANNANAAYIHFNKSRSGTIGGNTIVQDDDLLGRIYFEGNDGNGPQSAAYIEAHVDGTPGSTDMPGRLEFLTTPDGAAAPTERMRITSSGKVGIGTVADLMDASGLTSELIVGIVTAKTLYGDGSNLTGIAAGGGSGEFNTSISGATAYAVTTTMAAAYTANASNSHRTVVHSIHVTNISGSEVTISGEMQASFSFAHTIPVPAGSAVELLKQPKILGPSETIELQASSNSALQASIIVEYKEDTDFWDAQVDVTSAETWTDLYTSTSNPSVVQSILLANDDGTNDVKARVVWTDGSDNIQAYLCYDLVVPADSTIELCEKPKYLAAGYKLRVYANQADRLEVTASGKQITS